MADVKYNLTTDVGHPEDILNASIENVVSWLKDSGFKEAKGTLIKPEWEDKFIEFKAK